MPVRMPEFELDNMPEYMSENISDKLINCQKQYARKRAEK